MLSPFDDMLGKNLQFLIILIWLLMIVFAVEVIARVDGKMGEKTKKIFTVIYVTTGSCMAVLMLYASHRQLWAEIRTWANLAPWIIGFAASVLTAIFIQQGSKTTK